MLRVTGRRGSLERARTEGADVRVVYSAMDAVAAAAARPGRQVVFAAVGFETTAPATAVAVLEARRLGLEHVTMLGATVQHCSRQGHQTRVPFSPYEGRSALAGISLHPDR